MTVQTEIKSKEIVVAALRELAILVNFADDRRRRFKMSQYNKAAETVEQLDEELTLGLVESLIRNKGNGIGIKIGDKIKEILVTGTCSGLKKLRKRHGHLLELTQIAGIGPTHAKTLFNEYGARTREDVRRLVAEDKIKDRRIIEGAQREDQRIPYSIAREMANNLIEALQAAASEFIVGQPLACGSLRRQKETIGDIDIVVVTHFPHIVRMSAVKLLDEVSDDGDAGVGGVVNNIHVDFRFCTEDNFGAMLIYFTGNKEFNIQLRLRAKKCGWTLNEYGLFNDRGVLAGKAEADIFEALGVQYVEPRNRIPSYIVELTSPLNKGALA